MSKTETDEGNRYDPSWITGKDLERHLELERSFLEFAQLFKYEEKNDRALAIVGAAFLDTLLEHILISFLVDDPKEVAELLRPDQPLGTYGSRVRAAYCLGLINKAIRDDLRAIGKIRNRFAHDLHVSFDDEQVRSWCHDLKWHRTVYMQPPPDASARELFYVGLHQLVGQLNGTPSIARSAKRMVLPEC